MRLVGATIGRPKINADRMQERAIRESPLQQNFKSPRRGEEIACNLVAACRLPLGRPLFVNEKSPAQGGAGVNYLRVLGNHYDLE